MIIQTTKQLPPRAEHDHYPTPRYTVESAFDLLLRHDPDFPGLFIADAGCGNGIWGEVARERWPLAWIDGIDVREVPKHETYQGWWTGDFLQLPDVGYPDYWIVKSHLVMGNPPYRFAEEFVRKALEFTYHGGYVLFLMRLAFLESQRRRDGLFKEFPPRFVGVCSKRPSFTGDGRTNATSFAIFLWQKGYSGLPTLEWL